MSLSTLVITASESAGHGDPAIHPYLVGGIALGILLTLLAILVAVGGGREHS